MRHRFTFIILAATIIALFLAGPASAAKKCYDCHKDSKTEFTSKKSVHAPVKDENCEGCHKRHGFANNLVLKETTSELCYSCHADLKATFSTGEMHFPVEKANCWECHDPHASNKKALLRSGPEGADDPNTCMVCHQAELIAAGSASHKHVPYENLDCVACHNPHNSEHRGLLKAEASQVCASCHKPDSKEIKTAHADKHIEGLACNECHTGHSTNSKGLLSEKTHAPFAEGSCDACHSLPDEAGKVAFEEGVTPGSLCQNCHSDQAEGPSMPFPHAAVEAENCDNCHSAHSSNLDHLLKQEQGKICAECHSDIITDTTRAAHLPVTSGDCGSCHEVHGSKNEHLAKATDASLCTECHKEFAAARDSAQAVHAGAEDCNLCHHPHQGQAAKLLRDDPANLCRTCHEADSKSLAAKSGHTPYMAGDCAQCHKPHYSSTPHLVRADGNELCLTCHSDIALRMTMPNPHPPASDDCKSCHMPHYSANVALLTTPRNENCVSCHSMEDLGGTKAFVHTPTADGDCTGCHNAHGSVQEALLTGRMMPVAAHGMTVMRPPALGDKRGDLCYTCHESLQMKFREGTQHVPVAAGDCDACHASHGSDHRGFISDKPSTVCGTCHELNVELAAKHDNYSLVDADCGDCHNPHNSKKENLLRENDHPPFADKHCDVCHTKAPDGTLQLAGDMTEICGACHDQVATEGAMAVPHAPFVGGQCNDCHSVHASDHQHLLKDEGNHLCFTCHSDMRQLKDQAVQHEPFMKGACLDCHKPHASQYASLTNRPKDVFCLECHKNLKEQMGKGIVHAPAKTGDCGSCHMAHAGPTRALLTKAKQDLCDDCHNPTSAALATAHHGFDMAGVDCQNCHEAHASPKNVKSLLLPKAHAPFVSRNCDQCHQPTGKRELVAPGKKLCLSCHADFEKQMIKPVIHAPVAGEDGCVGCHGPHVGYGKSLQAKDGVETCLTCHTSHEFTGKFQHEVAFQDCGNCHSPHSADYANLLGTNDIMEMCMNCHDDVKKTHYHPMGKETINPRNGKPLDCVGCHSPHSSDFEGILVADKNRKLCVGCHDTNKS